MATGVNGTGVNPSVISGEDARGLQGSGWRVVPPQDPQPLSTAPSKIVAFQELTEHFFHFPYGKGRSSSKPAPGRNWLIVPEGSPGLSPGTVIHCNLITHTSS